jgi:hypothetical protein
MVRNTQTIVKLNDHIKLLGPRNIWKKKFVTKFGVKTFHRKFYFSFNHSELDYRRYSGIILKMPNQINEIKYVFKRKRKS